MSKIPPSLTGIAHLYGGLGLARLQRARVCVVGIGGVGSWAVEALARSGVGALTLVDLDEVCASNINRQVPALVSTVGEPKVNLMAQRVADIQPGCRVIARQEFFTTTNGRAILADFLEAQNPECAWVVDAIDDVTNKCHLLATCRDLGLSVVTSGAAGGRRNPTFVRVADLAEASHDRMLTAVRRRLRHEFGFPASGINFGIPCVFSTESIVNSQAAESQCPGAPSETVPPDRPRLNCEAGLGSAVSVTGTFGFTAAWYAIEQLAAR